jgi:hypothetical protein
MTMEADDAPGLYLVTIEATPLSSTEAFEQFGGAFVNVYIPASTEDEALKTAQEEITRSGWQCVSIESLLYVTRDDYVEDEEGREHFEQALLDGAVLVFNTFPPEPDEGDAIH